MKGLPDFLNVKYAVFVWGFVSTAVTRVEIFMSPDDTIFKA